ncbi:MAG: S-layer protein [Planctomycetaceae bacterium]|nr:MAG: S-layer protein [Planctomycetaceae bacterium]
MQTYGPSPLVEVFACLLMLYNFGVPPRTEAQESNLRVHPPQMMLRGNFAQGQLVVSLPAEPAPHARDVTWQATYESSSPEIAVVTPQGRVLPRGNGQTTIRVHYADREATCEVTVSEISDQPVVSFRDQIRPLINKNGCVMGGCHSAQYGQGGFKLTVFGFDSVADREAMARDALGRRINVLEPEASLLVKKPTMMVPHGGGRRLEIGSRDYEMLLAWIRAGAPAPEPQDREIVQLVVYPNERVCQEGEVQQLRVEAHYADGEIRDVTAWARFDSLDEGVVTVDREGFCRVQGRGQAPVMVRFEGQANICTFLIPFGHTEKLQDWQSHNFIDELASQKFIELGIEPSGLCDDATFLRRIFLDVLGTLPTLEEIAEFQQDSDPDKRQRWIDRILGLSDHPQKSVYNERYAALWTLRWSDLLRNNSRDLQDQGMWSLHNWIKERFRQNAPFDQFVRELIQGKGSVYQSGPANYFLLNNNPNELAESTAQTFLGVRLQCAQCHHHPFEKYGQEDYYGFAAFFARVGIKSSQEFGLFGNERVVIARTSGEVRHPRTGKLMPPKPLDAPEVDHPLDRRIALAEWMTNPQNTTFSRATANRFWKWMMGRGLVEPVDDLRATNPPTNVALMQALSEELVRQQFDIKQFLRTIMTSRLYQLDSQPTSHNVYDDKFYSHYLVKRLAAEPLLDAIDDACGTRTKFPNLPLGTRAIEIPDAEYPDVFLNTFAKPRRTSVCECERPSEPNLAQALHTLNGDVIAAKISHPQGRIARLLQNQASQEAIVTELYLATLSRQPTPAEHDAAMRIVQGAPTPKEGYEDLLWALLNSKAFLFVH